MDFIDYIYVGSEKLIGIAIIEIKLDDPDLGKTPLRFAFKEMPGKNGQGSFIQSCAICKGKGPDGKDQYVNDFILDSNFAKEKLMSFIRMHINLHAQGLSAQPAQVRTTYTQPTYQQAQGRQEEVQMDMPF